MPKPTKRAKQPAKKPVAKKPVAKKPAKKPVAKKPATKEPAAKKPAAKKPTAKQPTAKQPAKKPIAKQAVPSATRFIKATTPTPSGSSSAGSWKPPRGVDWTMSVTEFLGRLWALFGPPTGDNGKGYEYDLVDTATGERVNAYSGASGPSFGNLAGAPSAATAALAALIDATAPVDCETTVDYGASRIGIAKGKHFYEYRGPDDDSFAD